MSGEERPNGAVIQRAGELVASAAVISPSQIDVSICRYLKEGKITEACSRCASARSSSLNLVDPGPEPLE